MWQDFANTLNELNKAYKALIELGKKKRNALVMVDMKTVENLLPQEEKITADIAQLEKKRQDILLQVAAHSEKLRPESKMEDILGIVPAGKMQEVLRMLYAMLQNTVKEAQEISEGNALLIRAAMNAVTFHLNRIGGAAVEPAYSRGGEVVTHRRNFDCNA
ncbi:flagellar protein FlgN [Selenomonas ruminantium]|uniref:flagellar protein FlgN n=1 Tax=Selenomonas ruminantium TaxID=971 RepID=UPI0026EEDD3C|nr:flagellar protein FlgN [Selenomonas ruminantium]